MITASTRVAAIIGDPVRHSLSPILHNAAFDALGLDWIYTAFEVHDGGAVDAINAVRSLHIDGLSVTMPHKEAVIDALDRVSPAATRLRSVNCVHWLGDALVGDSTDGVGFIDALRHDEGFDVAGRSAVVLGAGGAARAVVLALAEAGAAQVLVVNRSPERGASAAALGGSRSRIGTAADVTGADIVVNATPVGMAGTSSAGASPIDVDLVRPGQLIVDLVYHPLRTPLLIAAKARGAVAVTGLGMLIHQAAHAFRLWTGEEPPLEVMSAAALAHLERVE